MGFLEVYGWFWDVNKFRDTTGGNGPKTKIRSEPEDVTITADCDKVLITDGHRKCTEMDLVLVKILWTQLKC